MVKIYSFNGCPYCNQLKELLTNYGIEYLDIDVTLPEHTEDYEAVVKFTQCEELPIISINNQLLIPDISFRSISQAADLTKKFLS